MKQQIENIIKENLPPSENSLKDKKHKHDFKAFTVLFECECGEKIAVELSVESDIQLLSNLSPNKENK